MNSTYAAPAATTRGDVVRATLAAKAFGHEVVNPSFVVCGGSGLSFGL